MEQGMSKLQLVFKERRTDGRKTLTGLMPGRLFLIASNRTMSARPIDVSRHGLGVIMSEKIPEDTEIGLSVEKKQIIKMRIVWTKDDFGKRDLYRYGLECIDAKIDLAKIFQATGCLK